MSSGQLLLIPSPIAQPAWSTTPESTFKAILSCEVMVCERIRTARRWIKPLMSQDDFDKIHFIEMDKHDPTGYLPEARAHLQEGKTVGVVSEAGLPCIGDPGAELVKSAHREQVFVRPIAGPNSFMMALMASGFNGQQFTFHGYLPHDSAQLSKKLQALSQMAQKTGYSQIFMEAPYRHQRLLKVMQKTLPKTLLLHISIEADSQQPFHRTQSIAAWAKDLGRFDEKVQAVYVLGK